MATPSKPKNAAAGSASAAQPVNKKVAKAARAGGGPVVRQRRRADSFTFTVLGVVLAGVLLIGGPVYGRRILEGPPFVGQRQSRAADSGAPSGPYISKKLRAAEDELNALRDAKKPDAKKVAAAEKKLAGLLGDSHWHSAYGIYQCDKFLPPIDATDFPDPVGLHGHEDGLVHIHPFLLRVSGRKARLGDWMDAMSISSNSKQLKFPNVGPRQRATVRAKPTDLTTLNTNKACKDKKGKATESQVSLYVWDSKDDKTAAIYRTGFRDVRVGENQAYAFVIAPKGTKIPKPPSIEALAAPSDLISPAGAAPANATPTTVPGATAGSGTTKTITVGEDGAAVEVGTPTTAKGTATTVKGTATTKAATASSKPTTAS